MSDQPNDLTDLESPEDGDDIRAKMKAALDRKHEKERAGEAHLDAHPRDPHTHGKEGGGRQFRRKSGG